MKNKLDSTKFKHDDKQKEKRIKDKYELVKVHFVSDLVQDSDTLCCEVNAHDPLRENISSPIYGYPPPRLVNPDLESLLDDVATISQRSLTRG